MKDSLDSKSGSWFAILAALTIFVSAFLLFQVQPLESKLILPWFGGNPSAWNACIVFFQLALLAGYAYAHFVVELSAKRQAMIHIALLVVALATATVKPPDWLKPTGTGGAATQILWTLTVAIGLPYFLVATTGPLVQAWYSRWFGGKAPYRLYALSNVGSLLALLSYPFLVEPWMALSSQATWWRVGFALFAMLSGLMAICMAQRFGSEPRASEPVPEPSSPADEADEAPPKPIADESTVSGKKAKELRRQARLAAEREANEDPTVAWFERLFTAIGSFGVREPGDSPLIAKFGWMGLPMIASIALGAITAHLTEDVPTIPFMLVVPLTLYLLSFIICFDAERWYVRPFFCGMCLLLGVWLGLCEKVEGWDDTYSKTSPTAESHAVSAALDRIVNAPMEKLYQIPERIAGPKPPKPEANEQGEGTAAADQAKAAPWSVRLARWIAWNRPSPFHSRSIGYSPLYQSLFYLSFFFFACMTCHGELARLKPSRPRDVTAYFLVISCGGALGGMFVALLCPNLSAYGVNYKFELPVAMGGAVAIAGMGLTFAAIASAHWRIWRTTLIMLGTCAGGAIVGGILAKLIVAWQTPFLAPLFSVAYVGPTLGIIWGAALWAMLVFGDSAVSSQRFVATTAVAIASFAAFLFTFASSTPSIDNRTVDQVRGFFGVLEVREDTKVVSNDESKESRKIPIGKSLVHGRIQHGYQHDPTNAYRLSLEPTTYYAKESGVGMAIRLHANAGKMRVAVVGLGAGTTAAYAEKGETYHFYELDPTMQALSDKHFTYRADAIDRGAEVDVKMGDARLTMERIEPQAYDVMAIDAFSGDSIPVHLLTEECMRDAYLKHLKPDGILCIHISNRYLNLEPVVRNLAIKFKMQSFPIKFQEPDKANNLDGLEVNSSDWVLVTNNQAFIDHPEVREARDKALEEYKEREFKDRDDLKRGELPPPVAWTDDYGPLLPILSM